MSLTISRSRALAAILALLVTLATPAIPLVFSAGHSSAQDVSKTEFDITEGIFHDGLGTYAEVALANELIALAHLREITGQGINGSHIMHHVFTHHALTSE